MYKFRFRFFYILLIGAYSRKQMYVKGVKFIVIR